MNYIQCHFVLEEPVPWNEILMSYLAEEDFESFQQTEDGLEAYIKKELFDKEKIESVLDSIDTTVKEFNFEELQDQNWNTQWEENFSPIYIDKQCIIRANFHPEENDFEQEIIINPQMSFGTGHHQTTYMMMKAMFGIDFENKSVLDMGSGTGVLAILAEKLGCKEAVAIDIDKWAYNNTLDNIMLNESSKIAVQLGGAELLTEKNKYDIVLANINRNILINDMSHYVDSMKQNGKILMSGFYVSDQELIKKEASKNGLEFKYSLENEGWTLLCFTLA